MSVSFEVFEQKLDAYMEGNFGFSLWDIPDTDTRTMWAEGMTVSQAANEVAEEVGFWRYMRQESFIES